MKIFFKERIEFFPCHNLDQVIAKRFFQIRLHLNAIEVNRTKTEKAHGSENSSRTVKMRDMAKKHHTSKAKKYKALNAGIAIYRSPGKLLLQNWYLNSKIAFP